jgi:hypothetical protein
LELLADSRVEQAYIQFIEIATMWSRVSSLIEKAGRTGHHQELGLASELLKDIAKQERSAMALLLTI